MKRNLESRYLFLKRFLAYYPSTVFLRNSIIKIAKEHEVTTIRGIIYTTNRVLVFLIISSCSISIIEAIYFFSTQDNDKIKLRFNYIIYILSLDFNLIGLIKFTSKFIFKIIIKSLHIIIKFLSKLQILVKSFSIRSTILFTIVFLTRVVRNTTNISILPITGPAFVLDKFLEPIEIRWFYRPLPISQGSPFFFN